MSVEFVEPERVSPVVASPSVAPESARPGRLLAAFGVLAAVVVAVSALVPLYVVDRTAFVVDFDGTTTQDARIPVDAFGRSDTVRLDTGATPTPVVGNFAGDSAYGSSLSVSLGRGVSYAPWWLGAAGALVVAAGWALARPRSRGPAAAVAAIGGAVLGSVGAAWLQIRTVDRDSVPQIRFAATPDTGVWLLVAGGVVAVLAGVLAATRPRWSRRRRPPPARPHDGQVPGAEPA